MIAKATVDRSALILGSNGACMTDSKCSRSLGDSFKQLAKKKHFLRSKDDPTAATHRSIDSEHDDREEIDAVIALFLVPDAEKELNIPPAMRDQALAALKISSAPEHLRPIADYVYQLIRNCSHRNFIRLGVANGTYETMCAATTVGLVLTVAGYLTTLLRAFVPHAGAHSRWYAFSAWPMWWVGMSLVMSGLRGSCFFMLLLTRRQPLPWERLDDNDSILSQRSGIRKFMSRMMIFDRTLQVKDVHLRKVQHKIVIQSMFAAALFASASVLLFIFLPIWSDTMHRSKN